MGPMAFDEGLNEVVQALDETVACLLPTNPNQVPIQQEPTQDPLPYLIYNSESEPDSNIKLNPNLPWREVPDVPSFQLREAIRNPQPIENNSFPLQNDTPPPDPVDNKDRDRLWGDWVGCVSPCESDTQ